MKIGNPQVSVSMCRLRPLTFLPASYAVMPQLSVVLTDWLLMLPAVGLASRPTCWRAVIARRWLIVVRWLLSRQSSKLAKHQ